MRPDNLAAYDQGYADGRSFGMWWGILLTVGSETVLAVLAAVVWLVLR